MNQAGRGGPGSWVTDAAKFVATMVYKSSLLLSCVLSSLVLLSQPDSSSSAPAPKPNPAPAPLTPGIKIGALLGAGLVLKAYLLSQALAGDSDDSYTSSYSAPSSSYGSPSSSYGAPSYKPSYKPSYQG